MAWLVAQLACDLGTGKALTRGLYTNAAVDEPSSASNTATGGLCEIRCCNYPGLQTDSWILALALSVGWLKVGSLVE